MASLGHETAAALAGVVGLCRTTQEDVEALQRHDEAALALLDINDDDAMKVMGASPLAPFTAVGADYALEAGGMHNAKQQHSYTYPNRLMIFENVAVFSRLPPLHYVRGATESEMPKDY